MAGPPYGFFDLPGHRRDDSLCRTSAVSTVGGTHCADGRYEFADDGVGGRVDRFDHALRGAVINHG